MINKKSNILLLSLPIGVSFLSLIIVPDILLDLLKYSVFYVVFIILPGIWFSSVLLNKFQLGIFEKAVLGYPLVVVALSGLFWIGALFNLPHFILLLIIPTILGIKKIFQSKINFVSFKKDFWILLCTYLFAIIAFFLLFILTTRLPSVEYVGIYYQDSLWTVGNTHAVMQGVNPVINIRFSGMPFSYHMLQNIFHAGASTITSIDPFHLHFHIVPYYDWFFIVGVFFVGTKTFLNFNIKQSLILTVLVLFTAGGLLYWKAGYHGHLYYNPLSMFFGFHAFILIIFLIFKFIKQTSLPIIYILVLFLVVFTTKAVFLFIFPLILVFLVVQRWYRTKQIPLEAFTLGGGLIFIALLLKLSLYSGRGVDSLSLTLINTPEGFFKKMLTIISLDPYNSVSEILFFFYRLIRAFFSTIINFYVSIFLAFLLMDKNFRNFIRTERKIIEFIFVFVFISSVINSVIDFPGGNVYFIWYSTVITSFLAFYVVSYCIKSDKQFLRIFGFGVIIIGFLLWGNYTSNWLSNPWWVSAVKRNIVLDKRATINYDEWQAMKWIKNNTSPQAVFISDRRGFNHVTRDIFMGRFFGYSAMTGRQFYNEGDDFGDISLSEEKELRWDYVKKLLSSNTKEEANKYWSRIAADYVIVSLRFTSPSDGFLNSANQVYRNSSIILYERNGF